MRFLSPVYLWLSGLALPIIALYMLRLYRHEMPVASILLWQTAVADRHVNRPWQRLRRHWLLALQLFILLTLVFAAARPALPASESPQGQVLVLLDASASMQAVRSDGGSRYEVALVELRKLADSLERTARVTVISVESVPRVLVLDGDAATLRRYLPAFSPTDGAANWESAAELAWGLAQGEDITTLVVSDAAFSQLLPVLPGRVQIHAVGDASPNIGIVAFSLRHNAESYTAFVRVLNAGPTRSATLLLLGEDEVLARRTLNVAAGSETTFSFPDLPAWRWFEVRLDDAADVFPLDDRAWATLSLHSNGHILLVTPGNRFLDLALRALPGMDIKQATTLPQDTTGADVIVMDQPGDALALSGNVWLIRPGEGTACGKPTDVFTPTATLHAHAHSLLKHVYWNDVHIARATRYVTPADAITLLEVPEGPLLWVVNRPGQRFFCQAFALQDSDLPLRAAFPILASNIMGWLLPQTSTAPIHPLPAGVEWVPSLPLDATAATLFAPGGATMDLLSEDHTPLPHRAGLYRLQIETAAGNQTHYAALALLDPAESDVRARPDLAVGLGALREETPLTGWRDLSWAGILLALALLLVEASIWLWRDADDHGFRRRFANLRYAQRPLMLRLALLSALFLALADARLPRFTRDLVTVFIVDRSASMEAQAQEIEAFLKTAWESKKTRDRAAVIVFGGEAQVIRPLSESPLTSDLTAVPCRDATDIGAAVKLGVSLIPEGAPGRLVLITDGLETRGDGAAALLQAHARGVETLVASVGDDENKPEVWLDEVHLPARAYPGDVVEASVSLRATISQPVRLMWSAGTEIGEAVWQVSNGQGSYLISFSAPDSGLVPVRVCVAAEADTHSENNCGGAWLRIEGAPRVLVVGVVEERAALVTVLTQTGLEVVAALPAEFPLSAQVLSDYVAVVLVNVPLRSLPLQAGEAIRTYVRDLGGGFVAVGGPESFGVGGWSSTPLEEILPVMTQVQDPRRFPPLAMIIVIDKSGSMGAPDVDMGVPKIRLAAEAATRAAETLNDHDTLAVVAFDDRPADTIGPFWGNDRALLSERLMHLQAGGGGIYVRDSLAYADWLFAHEFDLVAAQQRHVILVADGSDAEQQAGTLAQVATLRAYGATVSVIAIGSGNDVTFLREVAREGEGRFYLTESAADLPVIFTEETTRARRSYIVEEVFYPRVGVAWEPLADYTTFPPLAGYVATTPKIDAEVPLWAVVGVDPLLAVWQYGLGRVAAWTSDATGRWAIDWMRWDDFPYFWGTIVRWVLPSSSDDGIALDVVAEGDLARITLDVWERDSGNYAEGLDIGLQASQMGGIAPIAETLLRQTAPGRYETTLALDNAVAPWIFHITGARQLTMGWVSPYATEFVPGSTEKALARLIGRSRAQWLTKPSQAFAPTLSGRESGSALRSLFLVSVAMLWPLDIAVRRLIVKRADVLLLWRRLEWKKHAHYWRVKKQHLKVAENAAAPLAEIPPTEEHGPDDALATRLKERLRKSSQ